MFWTLSIHTTYLQFIPNSYLSHIYTRWHNLCDPVYVILFTYWWEFSLNPPLSCFTSFGLFLSAREFSYVLVSAPAILTVPDPLIFRLPATGQTENGSHKIKDASFFSTSFTRLGLPVPKEQSTMSFSCQT